MFTSRPSHEKQHNTQVGTSNQDESFPSNMRATQRVGLQVDSRSVWGFCFTMAPFANMKRVIKESSNENNLQPGRRTFHFLRLHFLRSRSCS